MTGTLNFHGITREFCQFGVKRALEWRAGGVPGRERRVEFRTGLDTQIGTNRLRTVCPSPNAPTRSREVPT